MELSVLESFQSFGLFFDRGFGVIIISVLRNFMEFGWEGISFEGEAVRKRS